MLVYSKLKLLTEIPLVVVKMLMYYYLNISLLISNPVPELIFPTIKWLSKELEKLPKKLKSNYHLPLKPKSIYLI